MFASDEPFLLFDYFRVPYEVERTDAASPWHLVTLARSGVPVLSWPDARTTTRPPTFCRLGSIPIFASLASEPEMQEVRRGLGGMWRGVEAIRDRTGTFVGNVWAKDDGLMLLPFDPNDVIRNLWTERYRESAGPAVKSRLASLSRRGYYFVRPIITSPVRTKLRRSLSRVQARARFPRWPVETALHDFYDFLFVQVAQAIGEPVPRIAPWPAGRSWALVLTHDVEGPEGYRNLRRLLEIELDTGYRSSWNFVPRRGYDVEDDLVRELHDQGFEVGVHGLYHDGRDLASLMMIRRRMPLIRAYADRWGAVGFRSPATLRSTKLMPLLGFDYDSSYSDTAPFEPQRGGCCTWLPFMIDDLVELPITIPQDHTVFEVLGRADETLWVEKARFVREHGGMALMLTHPDYVGNRRVVDSYARFLELHADDSTAWKALPREVSDWWRRRSSSRLEPLNGEWRVVGPAANEAQVEFGAAEPVRV